MTIKKIISGGQTGADQGALDAAIKYDFPHGGWIPKGRLTERGRMKCPYCKAKKTRVIFTTKFDIHIIRERLCERCRGLFKTE